MPQSAVPVQAIPTSLLPPLPPACWPPVAVPLAPADIPPVGAALPPPELVAPPLPAAPPPEFVPVLPPVRMTLQLKMAEPGGPLQVHWAPAELVQASPGVGQEIPSRQFAMPPSRPELEDPPPPPLDEAELPPLAPVVVPPVCDVDDCAPPAPPKLPDVPPVEGAPVPRLLHARSNPPTNIGIRAELLDIAFSFGTTGHSRVREGHLRTWLDIDNTPPS